MVMMTQIRLSNKKKSISSHIRQILLGKVLQRIQSLELIGPLLRIGKELPLEARHHIGYCLYIL